MLHWRHSGGIVEGDWRVNTLVITLYSDKNVAFHSILFVHEKIL